MPVALDAARALNERGISAAVVSAPCIKPFDEAYLHDAFARYQIIATVEEHSRIGGLGALVAQWRAHYAIDGARLLSFGADDVFMHEVGSQDYARSLHGLTAGNIAQRCAENLKVKEGQCLASA